MHPQFNTFKNHVALDSDTYRRIDISKNDKFTSEHVERVGETDD